MRAKQRLDCVAFSRPSDHNEDHQLFGFGILFFRSWEYGVTSRSFGLLDRVQSSMYAACRVGGNKIMNVIFADTLVSLPEEAKTITVQPGPPTFRFTDEEFEQYCAKHTDLRIEMDSEGEMIIQLPVVTEGGGRNFLLTSRFGVWVEADGTGVGFDSSTGFTLPNGAKRSPDVSWMRRERWDALSATQKSKFARVCPDFVVELRSRFDRLKTLRSKMEEYMANGAQLGWLIDPIEKKAHIYRPGLPVEILDNPAEISGDPLLKGFILKLEGILD
jgi:Uma2 family endonuclease